MRVLFVCIGNICRSPMAEGILKKLAADNRLNWTIDSAAVESYHIGEPPHRLSQKICKLNDIDISTQRARKFSVSDLDTFDLIYALATDVQENMLHICGNNDGVEKINLFLNEQYPNQNRSVPDPWYGNEDGYHTVFDIIKKGCETIIQKYRNNLP